MRLSLAAWHGETTDVYRHSPTPRIWTAGPRRSRSASPQTDALPEEPGQTATTDGNVARALRLSWVGPGSEAGVVTRAALLDGSGRPAWVAPSCSVSTQRRMRCAPPSPSGSTLGPRTVTASAET